MKKPVLVSACLALGACAVFLNACDGDDPMDSDTMGGASGRGGNGGGGKAGSTNGGTTNGGTKATAGTSGGGTAGTGGTGGSAAGAAGDTNGGMPPIGGTGGGGEGGIGDAGAAGSDMGGEGGTAGMDGGGEAGMAGAGGSGEVVRTCANGCAELFMPVSAWNTKREWEIPLGAKADLSTSTISVRVRVAEGSAGVIRLWAKNGSDNGWASNYGWEELPAVGTWTTLTLTVAGGTVVASAVEYIGIAYDAYNMTDKPLGDVRFEIDSITISNSTVGPWDFTTSHEPFLLGWTPTPTPGSVSWVMPDPAP